jgi:hypothetical protein
VVRLDSRVGGEGGHLGTALDPTGIDAGIRPRSGIDAAPSRALDCRE